MNISRLLTGSIMLFAGLILMVLPVFFMKKASFISWFYGIPLTIVAVFILLNDGEDKIEQIKLRRR